MHIKNLVLKFGVISGESGLADNIIKYYCKFYAGYSPNKTAKKGYEAP